MFLREKVRRKNGKDHRYFTVVENRRLPGGRVVQRQLLHLGELNGSQERGWVRAIEAFSGRRAHQLALFAGDRHADYEPCGLQSQSEESWEAVSIRMDGIRLERPRQWGGCFLALWLWDLLELDGFWAQHLKRTRKGTDWLEVLKLLVCYRLLDPGSEWRLHRSWAIDSAMGDLLARPIEALSGKNTLYRCLDQLMAHRQEVFVHLRQRWQDLFNERFDVLLYDLTSTYFEVDAHAVEPGSKKRHGYSRDHRPDCPQVVIALVVSTSGLPLAYEVLPGNTADCTTLRDFLARIESLYGGGLRHTWLMDRGIPTEVVLEHMREQGTSYLVGTPKGRLTKLESELTALPWSQARESVRTKQLPHDGETYVFVESQDRLSKERAMRRRRLKNLWNRLHVLSRSKLNRDDLLLALGAAKSEAGRAWALVDITVHKTSEAHARGSLLEFRLNRTRLRQIRRREGRYLLRTNLQAKDPAELWEKYLLLVRIEQAFKDLKSDLSLRPIWHQKDQRIEAHIFVCFLAYCLQASLRQICSNHAPGLTPRSVLETLSRILLIDIHLPTTDGRTILLQRRTEPDQPTALLLEKLGIQLPKQPPPKIHPPAIGPTAH